MKARVQKIISNAGYCSRRKAEELILQGLVKVDGKAIKLGDKAEPEKDDITINGLEIKIEKRIYILFNKPAGYITTLNDPLKRKTIFDVIDIKEHIFPVGRLDRDTSGLLILTNDGDFANKIMHPRYEIEKIYRVRIDHELKESDIKKLENGVIVDDKKTWPARISEIKPDIFDITIHEGRNRIVRKMMSALGYNVLSLERIAIEDIKINGLAPGHYRNLTSSEINKLLTKNNKFTE
ncbi:MAG: hypothetical protein MSIBF_07230 [Candidatus Altiarchaeales archaeon IMC4]|nr:MAG: hypothetical protein MSIBF_07230 [Candidatus Altiarchaeales archaeon IMC4]